MDKNLQEIEEIAEQHSIQDLGRTSPAYECGFIQGVNYQKKIDTDKACEYWHKLLDSQGINQVVFKDFVKLME